MQPKRKDLVRPLDATGVTKGINRRSLENRQNGYQGKICTREEKRKRSNQVAKVDETPSHAWGMMWVYITFVHIAFRLVSGVATLCWGEWGDWPGPWFPRRRQRTSTTVLTLGAYVNAAYCGANPVSQPNPLLYPPCVALDPHCWASTLGSGSAGIGAIAWGEL
jgi:hypothetical protein